MFPHTVQKQLHNNMAPYTRKTKPSGTNLSHIINFHCFFYLTEPNAQAPSANHHSYDHHAAGGNRICTVKTMSHELYLETLKPTNQCHMVLTPLKI